MDKFSVEHVCVNGTNRQLSDDLEPRGMLDVREPGKFVEHVVEKEPELSSRVHRRRAVLFEFEAFDRDWYGTVEAVEGTALLPRSRGRNCRHTILLGRPTAGPNPTFIVGRRSKNSGFGSRASESGFINSR